MCVWIRIGIGIYFRKLNLFVFSLETLEIQGNFFFVFFLSGLNQRGDYVWKVINFKIILRKEFFELNLQLFQELFRWYFFFEKREYLGFFRGFFLLSGLFGVGNGRVISVLDEFFKNNKSEVDMISFLWNLFVFFFRVFICEQFFFILGFVFLDSDRIFLV